MALGLAVWRLTPDTFWRLTPREIAGALRGVKPARAEAPHAQELAALMALYPDERAP